MSNERSGSSSRKGRKSSSSDTKPKQPQRGLGVAQLEKIRLQQSQFDNYSYLPNSPRGSFYPNLLLQEDVRKQTVYSAVPSSSSYNTSSSASSSTYNFHGHQSIMIGMGEAERGNNINGDYRPTATARWISGNGMLETQQFAQPEMTRHFMNLQVEDIEEKRKKKRNDSIGSGSQNSETSEGQDLDLELRLSL